MSNLYKEVADKKYSEYFDREIIPDCQKGIFVDGGGSYGDTYMAYKKEKLECDKYVIFEPDPGNISKIRANFANDEFIELHDAALASKNGVVKFEAQNDGGSHITESDSEHMVVVRTEALDDVIKDRVGYLKLDVEGAELDALKGCKRHIMEDMPVCMICIYHKKNDILDIINFFMETGKPYKYYIRHASDYAWDTTLYCINN